MTEGYFSFLMMSDELELRPVASKLRFYCTFMKKVSKNVRRVTTELRPTYDGSLLYVNAPTAWPNVPTNI